jgi:serine/threonine protein kinase
VVLKSVNRTYKLRTLIGKGGMAEVYLAHDEISKLYVAIKKLDAELFYNSNIRKRFLAEAKSLNKMSHANIVKVTDLIEESDTVAFVMEYIEGETLKEYIDRRGSLDFDEIKRLFIQMLDAIGYVHNQQLVHRDIKPSNFMIDRQGRVKLMDFGIAKSLDSGSPEYTITHTSQQMGTPMYMSPEQVKSSKDVTLRTDIYSLGVVLWQMVSGKRPYDSSTLSNFEIQLKIFQEQLPKLNSPWDAVIQKATEKKEQSRYLDSRDFMKAFQSVSKSSEYFSERTFIEDSVSISKSTALSHADAIAKIIQYLRSGEEDWENISEELQELFPSKSQLWDNFNLIYPVNSKKRDSFLFDNKLELKFLEEVVEFLYEKNIIRRGVKFIPLSYKMTYYKLKFIKKDDLLNELFGK